MDRGAEYGTNTGRKRRTGWLDTPMLRQATRLNTLTELAITKLDVLSALPELKVCVAYQDDTAALRLRPVPPVGPPQGQAGLRDGRRLERGPDRRERFEDLPPAARDYVRLIEELAGVPVTFVRGGPARDQTVIMPAAA